MYTETPLKTDKQKTQTKWYSSTHENLKDTSAVKSSLIFKEKKTLYIMDTYNQAFLKQGVLLLKTNNLLQLINIKRSYIIASTKQPSTYPFLQAKNLRRKSSFNKLLKKLNVDKKLIIQKFKIETHVKHWKISSKNNNTTHEIHNFLMHQSPFFPIHSIQDTDINYRLDFHHKDCKNKKKLIYSLCEKLNLPKPKKIFYQRNKFKQQILKMLTQIASYIVDQQENKSPLTQQHIALKSLEQIQLATEQVPGIIHTKNIECLHDFRVSLRKIRSMLAIDQEIHPKRSFENTQASIRSLVKPTNRLRDLDVLMELLKHRSKAGSYQKKRKALAIKDVIDLVKKQQKQEAKSISHYLISTDYLWHINNAINALQQQLSAGVKQNFSHKHMHEGLIQQYNHSLNIWLIKKDNAKDKQIHELRIHLKKIRYWLDCFSAYFPKKNLQRAMSDLKNLQTILGRFNDSCNQIILLESLDKEDKLSSMSKQVLKSWVYELKGFKNTYRRKALLALHIFFSKSVQADFYHLGEIK